MIRGKAVVFMGSSRRIHSHHVKHIRIRTSNVSSSRESESRSRKRRCWPDVVSTYWPSPIPGHANEERQKCQLSTVTRKQPCKIRASETDRNSIAVRMQKAPITTRGHLDANRMVCKVKSLRPDSEPVDHYLWHVIASERPRTDSHAH